MQHTEHHHLILKILIGSAWADRHLEPQEISYLHTLLERYELSHDPQLQVLLKTPVSLEQTERWMIAYLKEATDEERLVLMANIGKVLIADQVVNDREHDLLDEYHALMASIPTYHEAMPDLIKALGKLVQNTIKALGKLGSGQ